VFTGYSMSELAGSRWRWRDRKGDRWVNGNNRLFGQIKQFLDFGVFGRYRQSMACTDKPLCGSRNQEVVFFGDRYSHRDLQPQSYEVTINAGSGVAIVTGFPPANR
jgi:hypothetical protein